MSRFVTILFVAAVSTAAFGGGTCTPPPNEQCDGAVVFGNADLPYGITAPLGCVNDEVDKPYFDVFYRFDVTETRTYAIHMCNSSGDTHLRVYGDGCGFGDGFEMAEADDECPGSPPNADPLLLIELEAGQSYWLELGTWRDVPPWAPPPNSPYNLVVTHGDPPPGQSVGTINEALRLDKGGSGITLSWGASCIPTDTDYAIYTGQLDLVGKHQPLTCTTGGATSYSAHAPAGNAYFLVTAHNGLAGGSYGTTSAGGQRSQGNPSCFPRSIGVCP